MAAKSSWRDAASKMLKVPMGPPLPRKELLALMIRLRKFVDQMIAKLERDIAAEKRKAKPRRSARRRKPG